MAKEILLIVKMFYGFVGCYFMESLFGHNIWKPQNNVYNTWNNATNTLKYIIYLT